MAFLSRSQTLRFHLLHFFCWSNCCYCHRLLRSSKYFCQLIMMFSFSRSEIAFANSHIFLPLIAASKGTKIFRFVVSKRKKYYFRMRNENITPFSFVKYNFYDFTDSIFSSIFFYSLVSPVIVVVGASIFAAAVRRREHPFPQPIVGKWQFTQRKKYCHCCLCSQIFKWIVLARAFATRLSSFTFHDECESGNFAANGIVWINMHRKNEHRRHITTAAAAKESE